MDSLTFTIDISELDNTDFDQLTSDIQAFLNILHHASPAYVIAGTILQMQLDEQVKKHKEKTDPKREMQLDEQVKKHKEKTDPKREMQKYLDTVCPFSIDNEIASTGFWQYYDKLYKTIGETMGPVSYAAFKLARYIEEQNLPAYKKEHNAGTKWVWDFVKYYEENWEF